MSGLPLNLPDSKTWAHVQVFHGRDPVRANVQVVTSDACKEYKETHEMLNKPKTLSPDRAQKPDGDESQFLIPRILKFSKYLEFDLF